MPLARAVGSQLKHTAQLHGRRPEQPPTNINASKTPNHEADLKQTSQLGPHQPFSSQLKANAGGTNQQTPTDTTDPVHITTTTTCRWGAAMGEGCLRGTRITHEALTWYSTVEFRPHRERCSQVFFAQHVEWLRASEGRARRSVAAQSKGERRRATPRHAANKAGSGRSE